EIGFGGGELVGEGNWGRRTFVCEIDPVIETVDWVVDRVLRIGDGESGQYYSPSVRLAVAVGIFQVDDIGRIGDQHPFFPAHHAGRHGQLVCEDRAPVGPAVTVSILEQDDSADLAFDIQRVSGILDHIDSTVFIELHRDRAADVRLGDVGVDAEPRLDSERFQRVLRTVRWAGAAAGECRRGEQWDDDRELPEVFDQTGHLVTTYLLRFAATSGFTQARSGSPFSPAIRLSAAISAIPLRLLTVALAIWGATMQLRSPTSGLLASGGSGSVTSSPAAKIVPLVRAAARSASTTSGPRAVFTNTAVGFILANAPALNMPRVLSFKSACTEMKSDSDSRRSNETRSAPSSRSACSFDRWS